ncbi:hypothetical protein GCM10022271_20900 [Corallibacter vietnamensis]|uniref:Uncharacterized protein n=2 Tax=Flavobacteriaceae TaxID=49546 RepID=A0ABP7HBA5_9FLAO
MITVTKHNKRLVLFLMVLFLSLRVLGLHALTHDCDDAADQDCAICHVVTTQNIQPSTTPQAQDFIIEFTEFPFENTISTNYCLVTSNTFEVNQLFSRPPPYIL